MIRAVKTLHTNWNQPYIPTQCPAQIISFTYTLHKRMNDHRHDVETIKENLMANHANYQN